MCRDKMIERGADIWAWLEEGAHFYVCGDAERMAKDVEKALVSIAHDHGRLDEERAAAYVQTLAREEALPARRLLTRLSATC